MKLSVVISAFNEEHQLPGCLESVADLADEIIVVDHSSTDRTKDIVRKYTKKIFTRPNDPAKIDIQKNFGFSKATNDWILSLDADERVTPELIDEIKERLRTSSQDGPTAYKLPRKNIIFGKWIQHSIWWPDYQVRLFRRGKGEYKAEKVHQQLQVQGTIGTLESPLQHENYQTVSQFLRKMDSYTENEAEALIRDNAHLSWNDMIRLPVRDFLKTFFLQEGYKDGLHGLVLSTLQAGYSFLVNIKVWEKQGFVEDKNTHFLEDFFMTWKGLQKELYYWFYSELGKVTRNPLTKVKYKVLQKQTARQIEKS